MKKRYRSFRKAKKDNTGIKLVIGILAAILFLVGGLSTVVIMDNNKICSEIGLSGFLKDECYSEKGYSFSKVAVIVGNTANTPEPSIRDNEKLKKYLSSSLINEESEIEIYSVTPDKKRLRFDRDEVDIESLEDQVSSVKSALEEIDTVIKSEPTVSGAMYLETITRAARYMSASKEDEGLIIVIGSGLSDNGLLNFASKDLLNKDVDDILDEITKDGDEAIVRDSLKNITIVWAGIGETASPQVDLTDPEIKKLEEIYENVFKRMGSKDIHFLGGVKATESVKTKYTVKEVKSDGWEKYWGDGEKRQFGDDSSLAFDGDRASLKDSSAARKTLSSLADGIKGKYSHYKINIEGYVAKRGCNGNVDTELSRQRAETVKKLLESMGVPSSSIVATGMGWGGKNECPNGSWNEGIAKQNRIVKIYVQ